MGSWRLARSLHILLRIDWMEALYGAKTKHVGAECASTWYARGAAGPLI